MEKIICYLITVEVDALPAKFRERGQNYIFFGEIIGFQYIIKTETITYSYVPLIQN
ncbi:hypothetical protein HanIR_Chr13g0652101 [Helianthus annuus]|nr:hypothetical protein HanIR_Chr13g0652101 [Helianthus annuus]